MNYRQTAGVLLFVGTVQFIFGMLIAEFLYPEYSNSLNYISDLGATCRATCIVHQPSAFIFNTSAFIFGILILASSYFIWREFQNRLASFLIGFSGIGIIGVGLFPETAGLIHPAVSFVAFFFGGLSAIDAYKLTEKPVACLFVLMGVISLSALVLFISGNFLGIGPGGMERIIAYPLLLWIIGFGGYLMGQKRL